MTPPRYFVIIHSQNGQNAIPMTDDCGDVKMFDLESEAMQAAEENDMARTFGWDVFMLGVGVNGGDAL
jgi:6-phosphogluconolactonase/glucosamine-6-phosphate isomerase/deaminase